jgi:hypothetical protein
MSYTLKLQGSLMFHSKNISELPSHTIHLGLLKDEQEVIDEVLLSLFKGPKSYTGEDTIEISGHGSPYIQQQIIDTYNVLCDIDTPYIVSIFAGGISDTGLDPLPYIQLAVDTFRSNPNAQILWAGVKDNVAIKNSIKVGCHIITIPDSVMDRLGRLDLDLHQMSIDKVILFNKDASGITIEESI